MASFRVNPLLGWWPGESPNQAIIRLAHGALEAEGHPDVVLGGVVDTVEVGEQSPEEGASLQQLVPVLGGSSQAGRLHTHDDPDVIQAALRYQELEAPRPSLPTCPGRRRSPRLSPRTIPTPSSGWRAGTGAKWIPDDPAPVEALTGARTPPPGSSDAGLGPCPSAVPRRSLGSRFYLRELSARCSLPPTSPT